MASGTCAQHGTTTQLSCAGCGTHICPRCLVRTPVGFKCLACSAGPARRSSGGRTALMVLLAALVLAIPVAVRLVPEPGSTAPANEPAESAPLPGLGDPVRDAGLTFTVESFECQGDAPAPTADTSATQVCRLFLGALNHGAAPTELFGLLQYVIDDAGRRYGPEEEMVGPFLETLNPGESGNLFLVFLIPAGAAVEEVELHSYPDSLGARVRVAPPAAEP